MGIKLETPSTKGSPKSILWGIQSIKMHNVKVQSVKPSPSLPKSLPRWIDASKRCQHQLKRQWRSLLIALEDPEER